MESKKKKIKQHKMETLKNNFTSLLASGLGAYQPAAVS
jgi:hypothetical protein